MSPLWHSDISFLNTQCTVYCILISSGHVPVMAFRLTTYHQAIPRFEAQNPHTTLCFDQYLWIFTICFDQYLWIFTICFDNMYFTINSYWLRFFYIPFGFYLQPVSAILLLPSNQGLFSPVKTINVTFTLYHNARQAF